MPPVIDELKKRFPKNIKVGVNPSFETENAEINLGTENKVTIEKIVINYFGDKLTPKQIIDSFSQGQIITRSDLLLPDIEQTATALTKSQLLKFYKQFLGTKDLAVLNDSLSIIDLEDNGLNDEAKERHKKLCFAFKDRGAAIYNFARSGLFEAEIKERLEKIIEDNSGITTKAIDEFNNYFEGLIQRHPTNIYVGIFMNESELLDGVQYRLELLKENEISIIKIYCREPQWKIVETVCKKIEGAFKIEIKDYYFGKNKAYTCYLTLKPQAKEPS